MHEVLLSTLLLLSAGNSVASLKEWARKVRNDSKRAHELGGSWKPLTHGADEFGMTNGSSLLYEPLKAAYTGTRWQEPLLDEIGIVLQLWDGPGSFDGKISGKDVSNYISRTKKELLAAKVKSKDRPPPRWKSWTVVLVAELVYKHAVALRGLLRLDVLPDVVPTKEERLVEAAARINELEAQLAKVIARPLWVGPMLGSTMFRGGAFRGGR